MEEFDYNIAMFVGKTEEDINRKLTSFAEKRELTQDKVISLNEVETDKSDMKYIFLKYKD